MPLTVLANAGWEHAEWRTTDVEVLTSPQLWRRLHIAEWQAVPRPLRERALDNMFARYRAY